MALEEKIADHKVAIESCRRDMARIQAEFLEATTAHVRARIEALVEGGVWTNPDRAKQLGVEGLRQVKADMNEQVPEAVSKRVDADVLQGKLPGLLAGPLGDVMREAQSLLERHQFIRGGPRGSYRDNSVSDAMTSTLKEYRELGSHLMDLSGLLGRLESEKAQGEARNLWDQA